MKKIISVFLAVLMLVTMLPLSVFADEEVITSGANSKADMEIYREVTDQYLSLVKNNFSNINPDKTGKFVSPHIVRNAGKLKVYYALEDINNDGTNELFIGAGEKSTGIGKYDIFTHNGIEPVPLFDVGHIGNRVSFKMYDNGVIYVISAGGIFSTTFGYYRLPNYSTTLNCVNRFAWDAFETMDQNNGKYYLCDDNGYRISEISEKEYKALCEVYTSDELMLNWREISDEDFCKNKYIADIWLDRHTSIKGTQEFNYLNNVLLNYYGHYSLDLANELTKNERFYNSVIGWKSLEVVFDTDKGFEEITYLNQKEIYEALVFDLVIQTLSNKEYQETVLAQVLDGTGKVVDVFGAGSSFFQEFKIVDFSDLRSRILSGDNEITNKYLKGIFDNFSNSEKVFKTLDNFCFVVEGLISNAKNFEEFTERLNMYYLMMGLALEQGIVFEEMAAKTTDNDLAGVLKTVANIAESKDYSQAILGAVADATVSAGVYVTSVVADELLKLLPGYKKLKAIYDAATFATDLCLNTNEIIDMYYLALCTGELCYASAHAMASLADRYCTDETEQSAGAFINSVKIFVKLIDIDLQTYCKFTKASCEDGLINMAGKIVDKGLQLLLGFTEENTYDDVCEAGERISEEVDNIYDFLEISWLINKNYMRADYPELYPIYAREEITSRKYTPVVTSARLNKHGQTQLQFVSTPWVTHFEVAEVIDGEQNLYNIEATESLVCYDILRKNIFPKNYTVRGFVESEDGNIYSNSSKTYSVDIELKTPVVMLPVSDYIMNSVLGSSIEGLAFAINDRTNTYYDNIKYHIYRKTKNTEYKEIAVVDRENLSGGNMTIFFDDEATKEQDYYYKVQSEIIFTNGVSRKSDFSREIILRKVGPLQKLEIERVYDLRIFGKNTSEYSQLSYRESNYAENGVKITWNKSANAKGYEVYRKPSYGENYKLVGTVTDCEYIDTDVREGVGYDYLVVEFYGTEDNKIYGACSDTASIDYKSVSVKAEKTKIYDDEVLQLSAVTYPAEETVQWSSDNTAIATVDKNGLVTAKSAGTVKIKAMLDNGIFDEIEITIVDKDESQILNPGDMNGDGKITASDARAVLRFSAKLDSPTDEQFLRADVNGDNRITAADARKILRVSAKLETL